MTDRRPPRSDDATSLVEVVSDPHLDPALVDELSSRVTMVLRAGTPARSLLAVRLRTLPDRQGDLIVAETTVDRDGAAVCFRATATTARAAVADLVGRLERRI